MEIEYKYRRRPDVDMRGPAPDIGWGDPMHILRHKTNLPPESGTKEESV